MATLVEVRQRLIETVSDDASVLVQADYDRIIAAAASTYSRVRPVESVIDVTGSGASDYAVSLLTGYGEDFSSILAVEYPTGNVPATLLDDDEYTMYRATDGLKLRLLAVTPAATESFRVVYTTPRSVTTVPTGDVDAYVWLAASLALDELANYYAPHTASSMGADSASHEGKSRNYASRAKRYREMYNSHLGVRADAEVRPAAVTSGRDLRYPGGADRLTHGRAARRLR